MPLKDLFQNLKLSIVGTKTSEIDSKLDQAVKDITAYKSHSGRNGYIDLVRNLISKSVNGSIDLGSGQGLFSYGSLSPSAMGQGNRLLRYKTYEAIVSNINYCKRAIDVLVDNILSPDDITKVSLEIKPNSFMEDETPTEAKTTHVKEVVRRLKLEKHLNLIVRNTLIFGDFFTEVADSKTAATSRSVVSESDYLNSLGLDEDGKKKVESYSLDYIKDKKLKLTIDYSSFCEAEEFSDDKKSKNKNVTPLNKLNLIFHEARRVVKLQSDMFPFCFGYLVFPKVSLQPHLAVEDQAVNSICTTILRSLQGRLPQIRELADNSDLKQVIETMIKSTNTAIMNVRFVPPDRMQHFMIPTLKYYPYGESIFDGSQYTAKVLIAMETALAIHRINRSTEKRKIAVEIGLPRDARKAIESLKEEFRKRKVCLDSFGTVDTIPSMITTFEDIYIPQKDGKPFVDISTFTEGNVDVRGKVEELKFLRDQLVSSLGIPPAFIGIEENSVVKATLTEENMLFARTVIGHQKYLGEQVSDLIGKVYNITNPEEALTLLDNVSISFAPPKSLQFEREARYLSELANLVRTLEEVGVPKDYTKKKYLTGINWKEIEKYEIDTKIEKNMGMKKDEEAAAGGFGGVGGGMGGGF